MRFRCLVFLAIAVAYREIGRVVWHRIAALYAGFPIAEREVLVLEDGFGQAAERVAFSRRLAFVQSIFQKHVGVERIVLGRQLLPRIRVIERKGHLPVLWE